MSTKFEFHLIYFIRYCSGRSEFIGNKIFHSTDNYMLELYSDLYRSELEEFFNVN